MNLCPNIWWYSANIKVWIKLRYIIFNDTLTVLAVDDVYNDDDSYEYEYEYDDIDEGIMFECLDGSGNKIMLDYMCNGFSECDDGSDEDIVNCAGNAVRLCCATSLV